MADFRLVSARQQPGVELDTATTRCAEEILQWLPPVLATS
jgi:hypothetical protein